MFNHLENLTTFFRNYLEKELNLGFLTNIEISETLVTLSTSKYKFTGEYFSSTNQLLLKLYEEDEEKDNYSEAILFEISSQSITPVQYMIWAFGDLQVVRLDKSYAYFVNNEDKITSPLEEIFFNSMLEEIDLNKFLKKAA